MKKLFINIILILNTFVIYFLQTNFFSWFTIAGVKPNLFVIYVLFIGLFGNRTMAAIYGAIIGMMLDFIFEEKIAPNFFPLVLIGVMAIVFNKNFSKDSRITIMLMVVVSTVIFETAKYFLSYILYSTNLEMWGFIRTLTIETIFNIFITIIMYPLMQKFGYFIENEYKGNEILTRYF